MPDRDATPPPSGRLRPAERLVFFTDAVVAIAMTLLILPLMESVGEASDAGDSAAEWLYAHDGQLLAFVLSFVIVAMFWRSHHRLFEHIERVSGWTMTINFAWMFTIVWLPIPTALVGGLDLVNEHTGAYDLLLVTLYAGTMALSSLLLFLLEVLIARDPATWKADDPPPNRAGGAVALAMFLLFTLAAVLAALLPAVNLLSMWLLVLTGPLHTVLLRRLKPLQQQP